MTETDIAAGGFPFPCVVIRALPAECTLHTLRLPCRAQLPPWKQRQKHLQLSRPCYSASRRGRASGRHHRGHEIIAFNFSYQEVLIPILCTGWFFFPHIRKCSFYFSALFPLLSATPVFPTATCNHLWHYNVTSFCFL